MQARHTLDQLGVGVTFVILARIELRLNIGQFLFKAAQVVKGALSKLPHSTLLGRIKILVEVADARFIGDGDVTLHGRELAHDDFDESGLASTVAPDQANFFTRLNSQIDAVEQHTVAVLQVNGGSRNHKRAQRYAARTGLGLLQRKAKRTTQFCTAADVYSLLMRLDDVLDDRKSQA